MAARSNALSEITRFWLQARHGCLINEAVPVKVPYGHSDIDLVALRPDLQTWVLPDGTAITRAIIETKDEHDFDPLGRDFGARLQADVIAMADNQYIPMGQKARFSMLRQEHYEKASQFFGTADFDRLFVVHALDPKVRDEICPSLAKNKRIHWLTVREVVTDLYQWYQQLTNRAALRHSFTGDLWHLLIGHCGLTLPSS
jgi:hypothetical protein